MKYIGIDGCKSGWFMVGLNEGTGGAFGVIDHINELSAYLDDAEAVLLDIPIGLHTNSPDERSCDKEARRILKGKRASSVFPAPSRCALYEVDYHSASDKNYECTGRRLSQQSFAIIPKIREVDDFLQGSERGKIHEMHPEVCFWALNGQVSMQFNKKTDEGYCERISILERYLPGATGIIEKALKEHLRKDVARDDIVDALVGAIVAKNANKLVRIPSVTVRDESGLAMEIVYWLP